MSSAARDASGHRWSGWPGAYCFYCGSEDIREICLADGHDLDCSTCVQQPCKIAESVREAIDNDLNPPVKP